MENQTGPGNKIIIGIIILLALSLVGYGFYRSQKGPVDLTPPGDGTTIETPEEKYAEIINAKHQYKDGKHTYVGEFGLSPCHGKLEYEVVKDPLNPSKIELNFKATPPSPEVVCATVIDPRPFKVTFEGPERIDLKVTLTTWEKVPIRFNLFEVPASENIDTFEFQIKG